MKKILICVALLSAGFTACRKDKVVSKVVTVSYPVITLKGNAVISTGIGTGAYADPGATGYDDVTKTTVSLSPVSNNVDLTKAGFYSVVYTMKNANGYVSQAVRLVLVTPVSPAIDWSGTYKRVSNGQHVTITKQGTGLYTTDNIGGVAGDPSFLFPIYIGQVSDTSIQVPSQISPKGGTLYCTNTTFSLTASDTTFSYVVVGSSFGTAVRAFTHHP
ncbi:MAG TPA: immunoglobulin-like domain-containing protein [Bacteroidia bacterium]|jgi:hypothetical protein|nr:immunoglobulin-like domain-containing protein [Bacteroidia bacterium]